MRRVFRFCWVFVRVFIVFCRFTNCQKTIHKLSKDNIMPKIPDDVVKRITLDMSVTILEGAYRQCDDMGIPRDVTESVFNQFSLDKVSDSWSNAIYILDPEIKTSTACPLDEKNIHMGIEQLMDAWMGTDSIFDSVNGAVEDYEEVFATKGFKKKALREVAEMRAAMHEQLCNKEL